MTIILKHYRKHLLKAYLKFLKQKNYLVKYIYTDNQNAHNYLLEKVLPTIFVGIEDLSKEVEKL